MQYIEALQSYGGNDTSVFLAGGITGCTNWQEELVRVCTERGQSGSNASEPSDHQPAHSQIDKSLTAGVCALKIATEPTVVRDPGIGTFNDPVILPPKAIFCF